VRRLHQLILTTPVALLLLLGGYVYALGGEASQRGRTAEQIPGWRRAFAEVSSGKRVLSRQKALNLTDKLLDVVERQTMVADTAIAFARSVGACILLLGTAQAIAIIYVIRRHGVHPAA
jgi:hypothetical protein